VLPSLRLLRSAMVTQDPIEMLGRQRLAECGVELRAPVRELHGEALLEARG